MPTRSRSDAWYVLRGLVPVLAIGVLAMTLVSGGDERSQSKTTAAAAWSSWHPRAHAALPAAREVAAHIAPRYQGDTHARLVTVRPGALEIAGRRATVELRGLPGQPGAPLRFPRASSVLYRLCGMGPHCAVTPGDPSPARHLLLRRESLELALYSFRYSDVDQVLVFLPQPDPAAPPQALFFQREDLKRQLARPLDGTLIAETPTPSEVRRTADSVQVNQLTLRALFSYTVVPGAAKRATTLRLEPLVLGGAQPARPRSPKVEDV